MVFFQDQHEPLMTDADFQTMVEDFQQTSVRSRATVDDVRNVGQFEFRERGKFARVRADIERMATMSYDPQDLAAFVPQIGSVRASLHAPKPPAWNSRRAQRSLPPPSEGHRRYGDTWYLEPRAWLSHYIHANGLDEEDSLISPRRERERAAGVGIGARSPSPARNASDRSRTGAAAETSSPRRSMASPGAPTLPVPSVAAARRPAKASHLSPRRLQGQGSLGPKNLAKAKSAAPSSFFAAPPSVDRKITLAEAAVLDEEEDPIEMLQKQMRDLQGKLRESYSCRSYHSFLAQRNFPVPHYLERVPLQPTRAGSVADTRFLELSIRHSSETRAVTSREQKRVSPARGVATPPAAI